MCPMHLPFIVTWVLEFTTTTTADSVTRLVCPHHHETVQESNQRMSTETRLLVVVAYQFAKKRVKYLIRHGNEAATTRPDMECPGV